MWLLDASIRKAIENAISAGVAPTVEQQAKFEAERYDAERAESGSPLLTIAGNTAEIAIKGVITKAPSLIAMIFGGGNTTYPGIVQALAQADRDDRVEQIVLDMDSGGGQFDGLFDAIAAIQATEKPITTRVSNLSASAAYALASQTNQIVAKNRAARIGSIGVAAEFQVSDSSITITSTNAPKKRPDVTTEEGVAMVREELDALHDLFVDAIASGRNTSVDTINAEFGQGATLLADDALSRGMIDAIAEPRLRSVPSANTSTANNGGNKPEAKTMDLQTLKSSHPDVYAAVVQEGVTQERDRVSAHLTMGEASGDMQTAITAVRDGSQMTATLQATYMAAGMGRRDMANRSDDDAAAAAAANGADNNADDADASNQVAAMVESRFGVEA